MSLQAWAESEAEKNLEHYSSGLKSLHDLTDLRNADDNTRQDYAGRFAFELLQNASDAHEKAVRLAIPGCSRGKGRVAFALTRTCLVVANTGAPFSHIPAALPGGVEPISSLASISRLGESTKRGSQFMGNKGIGFRSIYQVCSRLWLLSGGYRLRYDGRETHARLVERLASRLEARSGEPEIEIQLAYLADKAGRIPMMKVGLWFEPEELPADVRSVVERLQGEGYDTLLVLDRSDDLSAERTSRFAWDRVEELSEREMLFLDSLCSVDCRNEVEPHRSFGLTMRPDGDGILRVERTGRRATSNQFRVHRFPVRDLDQQQAAVAFRLDEKGQPQPAPVEERIFYTFYPASRERHGFPFYVHSYFHLSPNREYFNTEHEPLLRNRDLLDDLASQIVDLVVPSLQSEYPDAFAPQLFLPCLERSEVDRLSRVLDLSEDDADDPNSLTPAGSLTARFAARVLQGLAATPLVQDLGGVRCTLRQVRLLRQLEDAEAADRILERCQAGDGFPLGVTAAAAPVRRCLDGLRGLEQRLFASPQLDLESLVESLVVGDVEAVGPDDTAAFLRLVRALGGGSNAVELMQPLRDAGLRLLACTSGFQPLPTPPQQGVASRASAGSPLVFYRRPAAADGGLGGRGPNLTDLPGFCHVHVLDDCIFEGPDGGDLRTILDHPLGLRVFQPEAVFARMADSVFGDSTCTPGLTDEQHREFLTATLSLVEEGRLRKAADSGTAVPPRWYCLDEQWQIFYHLAQSWIPVGDRWLRANEVILAGDLGHGDALREFYPDEQVFLDESKEAGWLRDWMDDFFEQRAPQRKDIDEEELPVLLSRFRAYVYRLLGAWDGVRLDVRHHIQGYRAERSDPRVNPHPCVDDSLWKDWVKQQGRPFSRYVFRRCKLIRSVALPHAEALQEAARDGQTSVFLDALERLGSVLTHLAWCEVRSPANSLAWSRSLMHEQLLGFSWATEYRDAEPDSSLWFTQSKTGPKTDPTKEAHYLRSITAAQMKESLARHLGLPVLEDSSPDQLEALLKLYEMLCRRVRAPGAPSGPGLATLYRTVVGRLQQLWLGTDRAGTEKIARVAAEAAESLRRLAKAGVLVHTADGVQHCADLSACYYDDGADSNPVFRGHVSLVAFDGNSLGIASLLGLPRLSTARVKYDDGDSAYFEGNDDREQQVERALVDLKGPLFAFLVDSDTIPSGQRMVLDRALFVQRWEEFDALRVEVARELWVQVDDGTRWQVPEKRGVVLEHAPADKRGPRRLFVFESGLDDREPIPVPLIAPALSALLGANRLAIQVLLDRFHQGQLPLLETYLRESCGVSATRIVELRSRALAGRVRHQEQVASLMANLASLLPDLPAETAASVQRLLEQGHNFESRDTWQALQDGGVELHEVAELCGGNPPRENLDRFQALVCMHRSGCLVAASAASGIEGPGPDFDALCRSFDRLRLDSELSWRLGAGPELDQPIRAWLTDCGLPAELPLPFGPEERARWEVLVDEASRLDQDQVARTAALTALRPWLLAAAKAATRCSIDDLAASLEERDLPARIDEGATDEDVVDVLLEWLNRQRVEASIIEGLLEGWPEPPSSPAAVGLEPDQLKAAMHDLSQRADQRDKRGVRKIREFRRHLDDLTARGRLRSEPATLCLVSAAPDVEGPVVKSTQRKATPPKKQRRGGPGEDDYAQLNFTRRVVGRCGEEFALHLQRQRWEELGRTRPERARTLLGQVRKFYEDIEDHADAVAWWLWLEEHEPNGWTSDEGWVRLRRALHMAGWKTQAPYDVLGLDRDGVDDDWSVYRIEVKATSLIGRREFPISEGELREALNDGATYVIWRVNGVVAGRSPTFFRLPNPQALIAERKLTRKGTVSLLAPSVGRA